MREPLSDSAVMRAVARGGLLSAERIREALAAAGDRPLQDVVRGMGVGEEDLLQQISQARVETRIVPSDRIREQAPRTTSLGKYELLARLGRGGMGEVWRARQSDLGREVALKLLLQVGDEERARFTREAELAASLSHPNIAQIYEVGEADGKPYLAMQLIEGQTLTSTRLPLRRALEVMRDAAMAVHHAHERGIVHRDLKPHNFMLDATGKLYVMDFGLARASRSDSGAAALTVSGDILGTPAYMAPEQARGNSHLVSPRTDVWGLGATLFEVLAGQAPYSGTSPHEILAKISSEDPPSPRRFAPALDRDIETIVLKCLDRDFSRRYETAADLAADLDRVLRGEPIRARRSRAWERVLRTMLRHPALTAAAALAALAALTGALLVAGDPGPDVETVRGQYYEALTAGDEAAVRRARARLNSTENSRINAVEQAYLKRERASLLQDGAEFSRMGDALLDTSRDHAIALYGMAVGLNPRDRHSREALGRLLPPGPASERLLGPAPGEARLDLVTEPEGAEVSTRPETSLPILKPGVLTVRVRAKEREAWLTARLEDGSWSRLRIRLPETMRSGCMFISDGRGGGVFLSAEVELAEEWRRHLGSKGSSPDPARADPRAWLSLTEAEEFAVSRGARLPTPEEAARAQGCWTTLSDGDFWTSSSAESVPVTRQPESTAGGEAAQRRFVRLAWDP